MPSILQQAPARCLLLTERLLASEAVPNAGANVFQNTQPLWQPIWARGLYGGCIIAQSLAVAQKVVPPIFLVHSMHCHFIRPGVVDTPILYHADCVREGKSISVWTIQAKQSDNIIFSATISFSLDTTESKRELQHQLVPPPNVWAQGPPTRPGKEIQTKFLSATSQTDNGSLMECIRVPRKSGDESKPSTTRLLQWIRVRSTQSSRSNGDNGSSLADHLSALAYVSDHYLIGTAARVHKAGRFIGGSSVHKIKQTIDATTPQGKQQMLSFQELTDEERHDNMGTKTDNTVEMMVTLSHTIFFHNPREVRADQWMLVEAEAPWAGNGRAVVVQKVWAATGVLVATCVQEGIIRLQQDKTVDKSKI